MKAEIKKLWVEALRSGEYKQTTGQLRDNNSFCCLGVLCNLHALAHPDIATKQKYRCKYMGNSYILPNAAKVWAGLKLLYGDEVTIGDHTTDLADHNDNGRTFEQIAKAIEEQL